MAQRAETSVEWLPTGWVPVTQEPDHPLAALEGQGLAGAHLTVALGPSSRFGARYFALYISSGSVMSREAVLTGLQHSGPLPTYNWIEVAATREQVTLADGKTLTIDAGQQERLFSLLYDFLPSGGHLMVEYDSTQRAQTARALALNVPPIATPLGELLFRIGFGAHFKDWQIAEGGSEGPRKLQAYKSPSQEDTKRWRDGAAQQIEAFLREARGSLEVVQAARERAQALLAELRR
ncbi:MAG: DUF1122 family protein [Dehalococcoidia bacterium]